MEAAGGNGQGKTRLDRIEELLERSIVRNEIAHEQFEAEHKRLLTAQVLFQDRMDKLDVKMLETTEKLNALIQTVDDWIRHNPRKPQ